jgi:hypothetical protein
VFAELRPGIVLPSATAVADFTIDREPATAALRMKVLVETEA